MTTKKWMEEYEKSKENLVCRSDLDVYFTKKKIGKVEVDTLEIGRVHFPAGALPACDPLVELEDALPYLQTVPIPAILAMMRRGRSVEYISCSLRWEKMVSI